METTYPLPSRSLSRRERLFQRVSQPGVTLALVMLWVALSPSLLPRAWWGTAVGVGVSVFFGYVVGELIGRAVSWAGRRIALEVRADERAARVLRLVWDGLLVVVSVVAWWWGVRNQQISAELVGLDSGGNASQAAGVLAGLLLAAALLLLARGLIVLWRGMRHLTRRILPRLLASVVATVLLVAVLFWMTEGLVYRQVANAVFGSAQQLNTETPQGRVQPTEPERSGSPGSHQPWSELGRDGQAMVADGPRAADIERVTGETAMEPIRVYAGLEGRDSLEEAVGVVVAEMVRTGALERSVVHLPTATGTGFVSSWSMSSVEFLTDGDVATVALQYSFLPSAVAFVTDRTTSVQASTLLLDAVEHELSRLPEDERPMLVLSGESLGAYGGQGAFGSPERMLDTVDGAVWTGTPSFTPVWRSLTQSRRPGSPEIAPVVDNGRQIRFVTRPEELTRDYFGAPYAQWEQPRVVYAQHASDPIVWWQPELLWSEPDWLRERVGRDVPDALRWAPWVSFWQIAADMPLSVSTPGGHGHHYHQEMVPYWAAVLGHDLDDRERLRTIQEAVTEDFRPR